MPRVQSLEEFDQVLGGRQSASLEVSVDHPSGKPMIALINGDLGWMMHLRCEGDAGFSSRNPAYTGDADELVECMLDNGQLDAYPKVWALPTDEVRSVLEHFFNTASPAPWITWHNDSGDGEVIPGGR